MKGKLIELKELKDYYIDNDIVEIHNTISFKRFFVLTSVLLGYDSKEISESDNKICYSVINKYNKELKKITDNTEFKKIYNLKQKFTDNFTSAYYNKVANTIGDETNNLVIYQSDTKININKFLEVMKTDFIFLPYEGMKIGEHEDFLEHIENIPINFEYKWCETMKDIFKVKLEKKDNIVVKLYDDKFYYYPESYSLTKIPDWLTTIVFSLLNLNKGGKLILSLTLININTAFKKLFELLVDSFSFQNATTYNYMLTFGHVMSFEGFKDNISEEKLNKLKEIAIESLKYSYSNCDYFEYMYSNQEINYKLDKFNLEADNKKLYIIDDFDLDVVSNKRNYTFIQRLNSYYQSQIMLLNEYLNRNVLEDEKGELLLNKDFFERELYDGIVKRIRVMYIKGRKIDKSLLVYIKKYNQTNLENMFNLEERKEQSIYTILNIKNKEKPYYNLTNYQSYIYKILDTQQVLLYKENELQKSIKKYVDLDKIPKIYQKILEDYSGLVPECINKKYKMNISSDFCKLWEIYSTFSELKQKNNIFFFGDNYQESIKCLTKQNKINVINNKETNEKISKLTDYRNIVELHKITENLQVDLIICNHNLESKNLASFQKYEYSKVLITLGNLNPGGSCVIKHSLPYLFNIKNSSKGNGFFVNLMLVYYLNFKTIKFYKPITSHPSSEEFYVIGNGFRGFDKEEYIIFLNIMKNFETNGCFYQKDTVYENFVQQIYNFIEQLQTSNYKKYQEVNFLYSCLSPINEDIRDELGCNTVLKEENISKVIETSCKKWINEFNFR